MRPVHAVVGWSIVVAFAVVWLWGMGASILKRRPGPWFWRLVAFVQAALLLQLLAGTILLLGGGRASLLHYVYGILWPAVLLVLAHAASRDTFARMPMRFAHRPWVPFAIASFFCFGLTLRALMTGAA